MCSRECVGWRAHGRVDERTDRPEGEEGAYKIVRGSTNHGLNRLQQEEYHRLPPSLPPRGQTTPLPWPAPSAARARSRPLAPPPLPQVTKQNTRPEERIR